MAGYFQTPNMYVPYNDRESGEIAPIAIEQLEAWKAAAETWQTYTDGRANRCQECHQNIWFTKDPQGYPYTYTDDDISALKVAHIRQNHSEVVSNG